MARLGRGSEAFARLPAEDAGRTLGFARLVAHRRQSTVAPEDRADG